MRKLLLLLLLTACGGGGGTSSPPVTQPPAPAPQPAQIDYRDYAPFRASKVGEGNFGKWISKVNTPDQIDISWPPSVEEFRIREYAGQLWVFLDAYKGGVRNPIRATRVEINEGSGWVSLPPTAGNPYIPVFIKGQISVRQWGWVSGECAASGKPDEECGLNSVRYFWQHTMTPNGLVTNVCWLGDHVNARDTIKQQEAWWTNASGWLDRSTPGEIRDGLPTGNGITYTWQQTIAQGAGYLWTGSNGLCLIK